jgi:hypothetical protein
VGEAMSFYRAAVALAILSLIMNLSVAFTYEYFGINTNINTNAIDVTLGNNVTDITSVFTLADAIKSLLTGNYYLYADVFHANEVSLIYGYGATFSLAHVLSILTMSIYTFGILEFLRGLH